MIDFFGRGGALKPSWYGDCLPSRDFPMLVDLHLQGRLPLDRFVSERIALDEVEEDGEVVVEVAVEGVRGRLVQHASRDCAMALDPEEAGLGDSWIQTCAW
jgi:hypothetical protein